MPFPNIHGKVGKCHDVGLAKKTGASAQSFESDFQNRLVTLHCNQRLYGAHYGPKLDTGSFCYPFLAALLVHHVCRVLHLACQLGRWIGVGQSGARPVARSSELID